MIDSNPGDWSGAGTTSYEWSPYTGTANPALSRQAEPDGLGGGFASDADDSARSTTVQSSNSIRIGVIAG